MLRKILLVGVAGVVGYIVGVRAGFDAGVRDYIENGGQMLRKVAASKDKFDYNGEGEDVESIVRDAIEEANDASRRGFQ